MTVDANGGLLSGGDFVLWVPEGVRVAAFVDRGSVSGELESPTDIRTCVAAGDIELMVPEGAYDLDLDAGIGDVTVGDGIRNDPDAEHSIEACVAAGHVRLDSC